MTKLAAVFLIPALALTSAANAQTPPAPLTPVTSADIPVPPKAGFARFESPTRLAADELGRIFVTDYDQKTVSIIDPANMRVHTKFPIGGHVTGVAVAAGRVYAGNESLHRIEIYDESGRFIGVLGGEEETVADPADLAIDHARNLLFAVDGAAKCIKVFLLSGDGTLIATISGPGTGNDLLQHPTGLTIDPVAQEVYVSDFGDIENDVQPRVAVFGYDGAYHASISGSQGAQGYSFSKPQGLAIGESGHVFVADAWLGRVVVMDRNTGAQVTTIGEFGALRGQLRLPLDILILGEKRDLYVTASMDHKVEVFAEGGKH